MPKLSSSPSSHSEQRASFAELSAGIGTGTHPYKLLELLFKSFGSPIDSHEIQGKLGINRNSLSGAVNTLRIRLRANVPSNEYQVISDNGYGLYHIPSNGVTKVEKASGDSVTRKRSTGVSPARTSTSKVTVPPQSGKVGSGTQTTQVKAKVAVEHVLETPTPTFFAPAPRTLGLYDPSSKVWQLYALLSKNPGKPVSADVVKTLFGEAYQNMVNALNNLKERLAIHRCSIKKEKEKNRVVSYTLCPVGEGRDDDTDTGEVVGEEVSIDSIYTKKSLELFPLGRQKKIRYRYTFVRESKMSISLGDEKSGAHETLTFTPEEAFALWVFSTLLSPTSFEKGLLMPSLALERLVGKKDAIVQAIQTINKKLQPLGVEITTLDFEGRHFEKDGDFYLISK